MNQNQTNDEFIKAQERLLTATFDQARAYSQVVLGIGYVSIFASWGFTKEYLTRGEVLWSALLACISLVFFVMFDVFTTFMASRSILNLASAIDNPTQYLQKVEEKKLRDMRWRKIYTRTWVVCWPVSFVSGIASAAILLKAFVTHLLSGH